MDLEKDEVAESSTAVEEGAPHATPGVQGDDQVPFNKHPRFQELTAENREYKSIGSPDQIRASLTRLDAIDQMIAKAEVARDTGESKTQEQKDLEQRRKDAFQELVAIAPGIGSIDKLQESLVRQQQAIAAHYQSLEIRATSETTKMLTAAGLDAEPADVQDMSEILAGIIAKDRELYAEYVGDPRSAVRLAFERYTKRVGSMAVRQDKANQLKRAKEVATLPRAHRAGGGSADGGKAPSAPKTMAEAAAAAEKRLAALED